MANKSESNKVIGEIIKKARMEKGLSLRELARKSGVSQPYLSQLESGQNNNPTLEVLIKLADALGITLKEMLIEAELIESDEKTEKENKVFKVNVDVSDALKGLKAIQREARKATKVLKGLEIQKQMTEQNNNLLTIEMEKLDSVPKVYYKGKEVTNKVLIKLEWKTQNETGAPSPHIRIEYVDDVQKRPHIKVIEHKTFDGDGNE